MVSDTKHQHEIKAIPQVQSNYYI